jgi:hypothetical protein
LAARAFAAVILPPLLFFAIFKFTTDFVSRWPRDVEQDPVPNGTLSRYSGVSVSLGRKKRIASEQFLV